MPRGVRGSGPGARKRLQREYPKGSEEYIKLTLSREEAKLLFTSLRQLPAEIGTRQAALATNIMYRITEQVMGE